MKVRIITQREFADTELSHWLRKLSSLGVPVSEAELRSKGFVEFECDNRYTKALTRYEIVREEGLPNLHAKNVHEWYAYYGGEELGISLEHASVIWDAATKAVEARFK